ncbi:hypothetical protein GM30_10550 [Trabulsiella odontotermitis]|nr:hypothetical protein GM30_10550 [Trabulsiella odontotermitis]
MIVDFLHDDPDQSLIAGGMSTDDITDTRKPRKIAIEMRDKKDLKLFLNAYNIEMYFEKSPS